MLDFKKSCFLTARLCNHSLAVPKYRTGPLHPPHLWAPSPTGEGWLSDNMLILSFLRGRSDYIPWTANQFGPKWRFVKGIYFDYRHAILMSDELHFISPGFRREPQSSEVLHCIRKRSYRGMPPFWGIHMLFLRLRTNRSIFLNLDVSEAADSRTQELTLKSVKWDVEILAVLLG